MSDADQPYIQLNIPMSLVALGVLREHPTSTDRIVVADWIQNEIRKAQS